MLATEHRLDDPCLPVRFWSKVAPEPNSGCWLWIACCDRDGYAKIGWHGKSLRAYRVAYETIVGRIPDGMDIDHLCRVRCCVNPAHLEPVTRRENTLRGNAPSVANAQKVYCPIGHEYTPENTYVNRGGRYCRACNRAAAIAYRHRKREVTL